MTADDFNKAPWGLGLGRFQAIYGEAYASSPVASLVASGGFAKIACVNAQEWLKSICDGGSPSSHETVRTMHSNDKGVVALEFRLDAPSFPCRYRHIYNIFIGLCAHDVATVDQIRETLDYAVVLKDADRRHSTVTEDTIGLSAGLYDTQPARWEFDLEDIRHNGPDERRLTGLVCRKAYQLFGSELNDFFAKKGITI